MSASLIMFTYIRVFRACSLFCYAIIISVGSSIAIILLGNRELAALL